MLLNYYFFYSVVESYSSQCLSLQPTDTATELLQYDNSLEELFAKNGFSFDFVLLGMGRDGHIGSVFPQHGIQWYHTIGRHLSTVKLNNDYPIRVKQRISLQFSSIVRISKQIGLLLTGSGKCQMMNDLYKLTKKDLEYHHDVHTAPPVFRLVFDREARIMIYFDQNSICNQH